MHLIYDSSSFGEACFINWSKREFDITPFYGSRSLYGAPARAKRTPELTVSLTLITPG